MSLAREQALLDEYNALDPGQATGLNMLLEEITLLDSEHPAKMLKPADLFVREQDLRPPLERGGGQPAPHPRAVDVGVAVGTAVPLLAASLHHRLLPPRRPPGAACTMTKLTTMMPKSVGMMSSSRRTM